MVLLPMEKSIYEETFHIGSPPTPRSTETIPLHTAFYGLGRRELVSTDVLNRALARIRSIRQQALELAQSTRHDGIQNAAIRLTYSANEEISSIQTLMKRLAPKEPQKAEALWQIPATILAVGVVVGAFAFLVQEARKIKQLEIEKQKLETINKLLQDYKKEDLPKIVELAKSLGFGVRDYSESGSTSDTSTWINVTLVVTLIGFFVFMIMWIIRNLTE